MSFGIGKCHEDIRSVTQLSTFELTPFADCSSRPPRSVTVNAIVILPDSVASSTRPFL